ncbi:MAG TPA: glutathione synthase [Rhodocyclaceae bacterium]|nr:glutathione synthase [Rhodocyclaceae bacterium]
MKFAFVLDPLEGLKAYKDSSVAMMRAAARRGHEIWTVQRERIAWRGGSVTAEAVRVEPSEGDGPWFAAPEAGEFALREFDAVLMRQDPPFDMEYVTATWLLERAEAEGARVFNRPRAIRDHSEKVAIAEFPEFTAPTLIARDEARLHAFIDEMGDAVLKPLDGMGGASVFKVGARDPNRNVIVETLTRHGSRTIMAQQYLPAIADGDKRILLIAGEPVPYCLARIPKAGESRGNLAAGGTGVARPLAAADRRIAEALGPVLWSRGLLLVGLDVIGDRLTEINVTSPTCFVEITQQTDWDVAARFVDALEACCRP